MVTNMDERISCRMLLAISDRNLSAGPMLEGSTQWLPRATAMQWFLLGWAEPANPATWKPTKAEILEAAGPAFEQLETARKNKGLSEEAALRIPVQRRAYDAIARTLGLTHGGPSAA